MQKEKGFYNFIVKQRYQIAKDIFKDYKVPLSQVIMLFADLYPEPFIKKLISLFDVKVKEIPYHEVLTLDRDLDGKYQKRPLDPQRRLAMREFLTFFLKKRDEILVKLDDLNRIQHPDIKIKESLNKSFEHDNT